MSGPSGVGKSSVVEGLARRHSFSFAVSMTTRARRPGEVEGVDYSFVDPAEFEQAVADGRLIEWAEYGGHLYGTPGDALRVPEGECIDVLLDIEIVGSRAVRDRFPEAILIFIAPPDLEELERRLRSRGDTAESDVSARLAVAADQMAEARDLFDYFVVNDELGTAIDQVSDILGSVPDPCDESQ